MTLKAPWNAQGFAIDYVFLSEEYDDYVGTKFNDKFYMLLNGPATTGGQTKVVNFTDCRDPGEYHDLSGAACPLASGYCCYMAINTALSECCWYEGCKNGKWKTDISGTGFECAGSEMGDSDAKGSSTGWLKTQSPIAPGETFTLTFHLHDTGDGVYDSAVILDNFRWLETPTTPGTEPVN
ncbi:MAG: choice-of-anchor L domain-containing protein [Deltaproteobacteria bacterium]|nr:choice-of-anchor L domain-containing protein [Deltaproteobacteria bacterium]